MAELLPTWGIWEALGHRELAGWITEAEIAGERCVQVNVPSNPPFSQAYGRGSLYCLTPTDEATARAAAQRCRPAPIHLLQLPAAHVEERPYAEDVPYGWPSSDDPDDHNEDDEQEEAPF
jgi:hypothetical protein